MAFVIFHTSTMPSSRILSKCLSFETRTARSWRHVAAWRMSAGSGVVTNLRQIARKFSSTRTKRVLSISAARTWEAVSEPNSSAYRIISSSHRSFPTSSRSSRRRNSRMRRRVAVSRRGSFTAAMKPFVSSKKVWVPAADKGPHLLPDLPNNDVYILPSHLLLQPAREGVHVHFLEDEPAVLPHRHEELRSLVDAGGVPDGLGDDDSPSAINRNQFGHVAHNAILPLILLDGRNPWLGPRSARGGCRRGGLRCGGRSSAPRLVPVVLQWMGHPLLMTEGVPAGAHPVRLHRGALRRRVFRGARRARDVLDLVLRDVDGEVGDVAEELEDLLVGEAQGVEEGDDGEAAHVRHVLVCLDVREDLLHARREVVDVALPQVLPAEPRLALDEGLPEVPDLVRERRLDLPGDLEPELHAPLAHRLVDQLPLLAAEGRGRVEVVQEVHAGGVPLEAEVEVELAGDEVDEARVLLGEAGPRADCFREGVAPHEVVVRDAGDDHPGHGVGEDLPPLVLVRGRRDLREGHPLDILQGLPHPFLPAVPRAGPRAVREEVPQGDAVGGDVVPGLFQEGEPGEGPRVHACGWEAGQKRVGGGWPKGRHGKSYISRRVEGSCLDSARCSPRTPSASGTRTAPSPLRRTWSANSRWSPSFSPPGQVLRKG